MSGPAPLQRYTDGTECSGKRRHVILSLNCSKTHALVDIKEFKTCEYSMTLLAPELCNIPPLSQLNFTTLPASRTANVTVSVSPASSGISGSPSPSPSKAVMTSSPSSSRGTYSGRTKDGAVATGASPGLEGNSRRSSPAPASTPTMHPTSHSASMNSESGTATPTSTLDDAAQHRADAVVASSGSELQLPAATLADADALTADIAVYADGRTTTHPTPTICIDVTTFQELQSTVSQLQQRLSEVLAHSQSATTGPKVAACDTEHSTLTAASR